MPNDRRLPSVDSLRSDLRAALGAALDDRWGARLAERALRHGAEPLCAPPLMAWRIAVELGTPAPRARRWLVACALFYGAADLLDDADDGDLPREATPTARAEAIEMLFASQRLLASFRPAQVARELCDRFAREGVRMARGQALDLAATGRPGPVDAVAIARDKAGAEFAALFGGAAALARVPPARYAAFGRALGTLVQVISDRDDALGARSRDFRDAKASLTLRPRGVTDAELLTVHAGDRGDEGRAARMRSWATSEASRAAFERVTAELLDDLAATLGRRAPRCLVDLALCVSRALSSARGVTVIARAPRRDVARDAPRALAAAEAFLRADPLLDGASEVCRHGLFEAAEVRGDLFGRLFAESLLDGAGVTLPGLVDVIFARADVDGWRYYPGRREIPPDADDTGLALQLAARLGRRDEPRARLGAAMVRANLRGDGLVETWLATTPEERADIARRWVDDACPVASAQAILGLWRFEGEAARPAVARGLTALVERLSGRDAPASPFYAPVLVDALAGRAFDALARALGRSEETPVREARARVAARLASRRDMGSRFGTVVETALAARTLHGYGALLAPGAVCEALIDAQEADGGYPADPFFRTVPHPRTTHFGARAVTTAAALAAMRALWREPSCPTEEGEVAETRSGVAML